MGGLMANGRVAVVVGITGKRDIKGKDEVVREALRQALGELDARFPNTPKILLSALAEGADTIAAEEALARSGWQVVAPIPLRLDLYLQDFAAPAADNLGKLLEHPNVDMLELDPLVDPTTGKAFELSELSRRPDGSNEGRSLHYEQVGLFIAQNCALMLAVMPADERPGRVGGTARVVDYRLRGKPDRDARSVLEHSNVLRKPILLDQANTGPVWLIDLDAEDSKQAGLSRWIKVLLPDSEIPETSETSETSQSATPDRQLLDRSLLLIRHLDGFNRRIPPPAIEPPANPSAPEAASILRQLRTTLSAIQMQVNRRVRNSILGLAALFVLAILALEIYSGFNRQGAWRWTISAYAVLVGLAFLLYHIARRRAWQPIAEDYRAIAEALRVQIVWWEAGLTQPAYRVDQFYLRGARGSLALVRAALRHMIDAACLWPPRPNPTSEPQQQWIRGQISFFEAKIADRRASLSTTEAWIWFLIMMAMGPIAVLLALETKLGPAEGALRLMSQHGDFRIGFAVFVVATGLVLMICRRTVPRWASEMIRHGDQHGRMLNFRRFAIAFAAGLLLSLIVVLGWAEWRKSDVDPFALRELLVISTVMLTAVAGALRFIADKMSWEAEVNGYEEILDTFQHANAELTTIRSEDPMPADAAAARNSIILELGKEALDENETWIRRHRERPLEPLVGG
jgi:hypothetical protein